MFVTLAPNVGHCAFVGFRCNDYDYESRTRPTELVESDHMELISDFFPWISSTVFSINYFKSLAKLFFFRTVAAYSILVLYLGHSQVGDIQRSEAPDPSSKSFTEGIRVKSTRSQVTVAMLRYDSDFGLLYTYVCLNTTISSMKARGRRRQTHHIWKRSGKRSPLRTCYVKQLFRGLLFG